MFVNPYGHLNKNKKKKENPQVIISNDKPLITEKPQPTLSEGECQKTISKDKENKEENTEVITSSNYVTFDVENKLLSITKSEKCTLSQEVWQAITNNVNYSNIETLVITDLEIKFDIMFYLRELPLRYLTLKNVSCSYETTIENTIQQSSIEKKNSGYITTTRSAFGRPVRKRTSSIPTQITVRVKSTKQVSTINFLGLTQLLCLNIIESPSLIHYTNLKTLNNLPTLTNLQVLNIGHCENVKDQYVAKVISCLTNISELNLAKTNVKGEFIKELSKLSALTKLDLGDNKLTDNSVSYISSLTNLEVLSLEGHEIDDTTLFYISNLTNIHTLNLSRCPGVSKHSIVGIIPLINITCLDLSSTNITTSASLIEKFNNLQDLNLSCCPNVNHSSIAALTSLINMTRLNLSSTNITTIAPIEVLTKIKDLNLSYTYITEKNVKHIAGLTNIVSINIVETKNYNFLPHVIELPNIAKIEVSFKNLFTIQPVGFTKLKSLGIEAITENQLRTFLESIKKIQGKQDFKMHIYRIDSIQPQKH